ncbi:MAG: flagellar hook capping FlgD N-terminal domain-containing protein [Armatimonadota bacterium]|nr:flagellar hook capping FlgD N-terminal domain-containing protein [Armatimonadota bacterium]
MINAIDSGRTQATEGRSTVERLGKQDFLNLLLTQLRYQNPLRPMEDTEFIAQLAQFTALEELKNVGAGLQLVLALSLVGRTVQARIPTTENGLTGYEEVQGKVEGIRLLGTQPVLLMNGKEVHLDHVTRIS